METVGELSRYYDVIKTLKSMDNAQMAELYKDIDDMETLIRICATSMQFYCDILKDRLVKSENAIKEFSE